MCVRSVILSLVLITCAAAPQNDPPVKHDFTQLHRLSTALDNFNFPEKGASLITVWRQGGGKGISATADNDEMDLTEAINMLGDTKDMDLSNVAVLYDSGRSIRFIDYTTYQGTKEPQIRLNRGDVVALMMPQ